MEFHFELIAELAALGEPKEETFCYACSEVISGQAYTSIENDEDWIHESCAKLQGKITHPLHSQHPLTLRVQPPPDKEYFICNGCGYFSKGFTFNCEECEFNLDIICGSLSKHGSLTLENRDIKSNNIYHFSHQHVLTLCNFRKSHKFHCSFCNQIIYGSTYFCLDCEFFVHKSCKDQMQEQVKSGYHPQHSLLARVVRPKDYSKSCKACGHDYIGKFCYGCQECDFNIHGGCEKPSPRPIKHSCHKCNLFCFRQDEWPNEFECLVCKVKSNTTVYRCVDCNVNFHLECIPLQGVVKAKCHDEHHLKLVDSVDGYDFPDYYCDVCEEPLIIKHNLYYCEECPYFAHIDCVISQDDGTSVDSECKDKTEQHRDTEERHAEDGSFERVAQIMIKEGTSKEITSALVPISEIDDTELDFSNPDFDLQFRHEDFTRYFTLVEPSPDEEYFCYLCSDVIPCQAYYTNQSNDVWIHESCFKLPRMITHPLHSQHPLTLLFCAPNYKGQFVCEGCGYFSGGFAYNCKMCHFNIDVKCGSLMDDFFSKYHCRTLEERDRANIHHFSHQHILKPCNIRKSHELCCSFCEQVINGSAYFCLDCDFFMHKSCTEAKRKIENQFHPQHSLIARAPGLNDVNKSCKACARDLKGKFCYRCEECRFNLHVECSNKPSSTRPLQHDCHQCSLFYFKHDEWPKIFKCFICKVENEAAVYRCVDCNVNFHLECILIPSTLWGKCNCDDRSLRLLYAVDGHDFPEYYCDVCEEEGNPKHHLYYCEECLYYAHIDCVIGQDEVSREEAQANVDQYKEMQRIRQILRSV